MINLRVVDFRQADSRSTRRHGGLGLGLAIARYLVEQHHGRISAHSEGVGKGTTVRVTMPLRPVLAVPHSSAPGIEPVEELRLHALCRPVLMPIV